MSMIESKSMNEDNDRKKLAVLFVDDEPALLNFYQRMFRSAEYEIFTAKSGKEALEMMPAHNIAMVVSDNMMPNMTGMELLARVQEMYPNTMRMMVSGTHLPPNGLAHYALKKPVETFELKHTVEQGLAEYLRKCGY